MDNLEKLNFTELSSSEMKEVQGGDWVGDVLKVVEKIVPVITPIITAVGG